MQEEENMQDQDSITTVPVMRVGPVSRVDERDYDKATRLNLFERVWMTGWGDIATEAAPKSGYKKKMRKRFRRAQNIQNSNLHVFTTWELVQIGIGLVVLCLVLSGSLVGGYLCVLGQFGFC